MGTKITFADLTHTGQIVAANTIPLGIAYVATYAKTHLKDQIDCEIFKYPEDFSNYLDKELPQLACFSNFSWNIKLGHEYAKRIKELSPKTITVFGGPNFPDKPDQQPTHHRSKVVAATANNDHNPDQEGITERLVTSWLKLQNISRQHRPADAKQK